MQFAYQVPERCERLVLVNSGGLGSEVSWMLRLLALPGLDLVMPVLFPGFVRDAGDAVWRFVGGLGVRAPHLEEEWRGYASLTDPQTRQAFVKTLRSVVDFGGQSVSAHDRLYLAEHLPTLIVWGEDDRIIPVSHGRATHEAIAKSELVVFDGCGHFPHVEEPMRFVEALTDFLERHPPMDPDPKVCQERLIGGLAVA
jgi:pimeloyl-ACP methyl ester carboxylesterase